jgi:hypothetical protein
MKPIRSSSADDGSEAASVRAVPISNDEAIRENRMVHPPDLKARHPS